MLCNNCGTELKDDMKSCPVCGAATADEDVGQGVSAGGSSANTCPKGRGDAVKKALPITAVILLILAAAVFIFINSPRSEPDEYLDQQYLFYSPEMNQTSILHSGRVSEYSIPGNVLPYHYSMKSDICLAMSDDNKLYYVTPEKYELISEAATHARLSAYGDLIAYIDADYTLLCYDVKSGAVEEIADPDSFSGYYGISPDGKTMFFGLNTENRGIDIYIYRDGKSSLLGHDTIPLSISDSGEIYAIDNFKNPDSSLIFINSKGISRVICEDVSVKSHSVTNLHQNEIFFISDGNVFLSVDGGEKILIGKGGSLSAAPPDAHYSSPDIHATQKGNNDSGKAFGSSQNLLNSFKDRLLRLSSAGKDITAVYLDKSYNPIVVAENTWEDIFMEDGVFYYSSAEDNKLYSSDLKNNPVVIADDVWCYTVSDGEIYYIDNSRILRHVDKNGEKDKIHENASNIYNSPSETIYFAEESSDQSSAKLYRLAKTGKPQEIARDIRAFITADSSAVYYFKACADNEYSDVYVSTDDGSSFSKVFEEVSSFIIMAIEDERNRSPSSD